MAGHPCTHCERSFGMAAHLARHLAATHGVGAKPAGRKVKAGKKGGRRAKAAAPAAGAARFRLGALAVEDLGRLIAAARAEMRRRIADLQKAM